MQKHNDVKPPQPGEGVQMEGTEEDQRRSSPGLDGFFGNFNQSQFNEIEEVITVGAKPEEYLVKARFTKRQARMIKRLIMEQMIRDNGRLNYNSLYRLETLLSIAVDAYARNQFAQILTGFMRMRQDATTGVSNWLGNKFGRGGNV